MCLVDAECSIASQDVGERFLGAVAGYAWGQVDSSRRLALLPDIYGCSPFYRGLAVRYAARGARAFLVDTFDGLGELPEVSRDAAFARRHRVRDSEFVDRFEQFCAAERITGVIGFCLGGLYIFELARRGLRASLVGLYGFPQGMPNDDALPIPFDYLQDVQQPFTMLMGVDDHAVGAEAVQRLSDVAAGAPAMSLTVYEGVGHNFLVLLDSPDERLRAVAQDALGQMDAAMLGEATNV